RRELAEEVGVKIEILTPLSERVHTYAHGTVRLHPRICRLTADSPEPQNLHVTDHRWCPLGDLDRHAFPEANEGVVAELLERLSRGIEGLG
ncbi:MAG: NUDIX domain-containing protein, partial [Planctomycetota bacterium]